MSQTPSTAFTRIAGASSRPADSSWSMPGQAVTLPHQDRTTVAAPSANQRKGLSLVIDFSLSMSSRLDGQTTRIQGASQASLAVCHQFMRHDPHIQVQCIVYGDTAHEIVPSQPAPQAFDALNRQVDTLPLIGGTRLNPALQLVQPTPDHRVVVISDGQIFDDPMPLVDPFKANGVIFDCIGIGADASHVDENLLRRIASIENGKVNYTLVNSVRDFNKTILDIGTKTIAM